MSTMATFSLKVRPTTNPTKRGPIEYVTLKAGRSLDTVTRQATDKDRSRFAAEYAAFRAASAPKPKPAEKPAKG